MHIIAPVRLVDQDSVRAGRTLHVWPSLAHLVEALHANGLAHEENREGDQDQTTNYSCDNSTCVVVLVFICVSLEVLEIDLLPGGDLFGDLLLFESQPVGVVLSCLLTSFLCSGLLFLDCFDLGIDVLLDLFGFALAENVGVSWLDFFESRLDVGLDDILIDLHLFPFNDSDERGLLLVLSLSDQSWSLQNSCLD